MTDQNYIKGAQDLKDVLDKSWVIRRNIMNTARRSRTAQRAARNHQDDHETERVMIECLKYWHNLEKVPEVWEDIKNLTPEDSEKKKEEIKYQMCEMVVSSGGYQAGYQYGVEKSDKMKAGMDKKLDKFRKKDKKKYKAKDNEDSDTSEDKEDDETNESEK